MIAIDSRQDRLAVVRQALWPTTTIPVCWENGHPDNAAQRQWVADAVATTWSQASPLVFSGWGACEASSDGIRIEISDGGPHTKGLGTQLDGRPNGMVLNFDFQAWSRSCQNQREQCIRTVAVHEFGHAIGIAHEQNRSDAPLECREEEQGTDPDWLVTPYDLQSVMNYCNPKWAGNGQLSASDIHGIVSLYGSNRLNVLGLDEAGDRFGRTSVVGDFNGDGVADLAVAALGEAPGRDPRSGAVFIYHGSAPGGLRPRQVITQSGLGENEKDDRFGFSLAAGDFNGDGKDDLAVGAVGEAPGDDPNSGYVFLYKGTAEKLDAWMGFGQGDLGANELEDKFGFALAAGDFDADGKDDLAVGAPGEAPGSDPTSGFVFLFKGYEQGVKSWRAFGQNGLDADELGDRFGFAMSVGDFDGDGTDDLAIGTPNEALETTLRSGRVFVFKGSGAGLNAWTAFGQEGLGEDENRDNFGFSMTSGDFDGDGRDDLVVGAPDEAPGDDPSSGYVFVYKGSESGPAPWHGFGQRGLGENEQGDRFGFSLAAGDIDNDGKDDLLVGAPGEAPATDPESGAVFVYRGASTALSPWKALTQRGLGANELGDRFGSSVAIGDFDGDRRGELAVGASSEDLDETPDTGLMFVFGYRDVEDGTPSLRPWYAFGQAY